MELSKIHGLIREKNEKLERDAMRTAESIIENIATEQAKIAGAQKRIAELRTELKALTIAQLNAGELLGEE